MGPGYVNDDKFIVLIGYPIGFMPMMSCPLCGKMSSIERYNPNIFADDIFIVEVSGLGRGRGFEVTNRGSIFSAHYRMDPIIDRTLGDLRDRTLDILNILDERGIIRENELLERMHQRRVQRFMRYGS